MIFYIIAAVVAAVALRNNQAASTTPSGTVVSFGTPTFGTTSQTAQGTGAVSREPSLSTFSDWQTGPAVPVTTGARSDILVPHRGSAASDSVRDQVTGLQIIQQVGQGPEVKRPGEQIPGSGGVGTSPAGGGASSGGSGGAAGGGAGGLGGRGGLGCFSGETKIHTPLGLRSFDSLPKDRPFAIVNKNGVRLANLVTHEDYDKEVMLDMGNGLVTSKHNVLSNGKWLAAEKAWPALPRIENWRGTVYSLHVISDNEKDRHFVLANGAIAHNKQ